MNLSQPLAPRHPDGDLRVILPGRISRETQDRASIASQQMDAEGWLQRTYTQPAKLTRLGEQASGWLADRETMLQAQSIIEAGDCDLVLVGELQEIYRNPEFQWKFVFHCLDHDTRFIALFDGIDTADETWEAMMHAAAMRYGMEVPTTRRRVKRKATHSFSDGGMVAKFKFGYRKLSSEEAESAAVGPKGLKIAKLSEWTPTILEMKRRVLAGMSREAVADWLNAEGIHPGPYATSKKWTGRLVTDLLTDPILSGQRRFRRVVSKMIYKTGKYKARPNQNAPEAEDCPTLAHMSIDEQQELLDYLAAQKMANKAAQKCGRNSPLWNMPRSRSLWPGQATRCSACSGLMYRYGVHLKCQNAVPGGPATCWNHVLVEIETLRDRVLPLIVRFLDRDPKARTAIAAVAWMQYQHDVRTQQRSTGGLDAQIADLLGQQKNLSEAIAKMGALESLLSLLGDVESQLKTARTESARVASRQTDLGEFRSAKDIEDRFDEVLQRMATGSREFADLLRRLIPRFAIFPVQALDTAQVRPRAELTLSTAAWTPSGEQPIEETFTVDLFEAPAHIRFMARCEEATRQHPEASLREIARIVGIGYMTVKRARSYARLMQKQEMTDPYRVLHGPPASASRWQIRPRDENESDSASDQPESFHGGQVVDDRPDPNP